MKSRSLTRRLVGGIGILLSEVQNAAGLKSFGLNFKAPGVVLRSLSFLSRKDDEGRGGGNWIRIEVPIVAHHATS